MDERNRETGSFRDPGGFVLTVGGRVFRFINHRFVDDWKCFSASPLFQDLQQEHLLIPTFEVDVDTKTRLGLPDVSGAVVEHERVPFVSYPYEWSFGMLKDAGLLHLDIIQRCLDHNIILKDATAFNAQFIGSQPVFIDVLSFARLEEGEPWAGYSQFCKMFLFPLMLQAYKRVPFQGWLRSELEGLDPVVFSRFMTGRDLLRPGVLTHVRLQAWMQKKLEDVSYSVRGRVKSAGFSKAAIVKNTSGLRRLLHKLTPKDSRSGWTTYTETHTYSDDEFLQKERFVRQAVLQQRPGLVWDLGCNTGHFSRLAGEQADYVVALDADSDSVEYFYQSLKKEGRKNILPLVVNLANLSPAQGWAGLERQSMPARGRPDFVLCLALIHHMTISANIPLASFIGWLAELGASIVIEFVAKEDAMVKRLLLNKDDTYDDYNRTHFESCLGRFFRVQECLSLPGGTRFLYYAKPGQTGKVGK